ncbi:serine/threonine protein kinase [Bifidobacterium lemurum]|uniref:non-specific serine/threonine protein kinase n=1 Tax=Bifidobacterium lemurum TaxID=1603886 RepID=A0A261FRN4_9BIFI|nr:Stk1 family PASTA domain-containing Ser/Thr kinase [Bifidobacterium lemurum]OZG61466.1 serine/threonine protein kinase [Bifidobacterium lemurum]QOL35111.1 Stk1 family PASTA domain-containing Ser/Thr kinase [Bifidobacterium lemurum]
MSSMPSALANGRYQLGQLIGRGGMAEVRVALDTRLGRTVAVKIMRADLANDEIFLSRFRREAHAVAQMNNPNIVNIYDSGEEAVVDANGRTEHLPYIVMEYVKGQTLRDVIKVNGPLSQRDAEQVMVGVLSALEYSHRMGIIHRDIKPGNIMISEQGMVKVMDFGIARALDDSAATMTQSQGVVGTAQYLSPEQARGETVDMRSDLYSAGCVLYEMLTGRPPFTGDSAVAIAYQHVSEVATPPSAVVPGLPKMWDSICAKAMAKDRQNRYATAAEFKNDVLTYMNGGVPVAAAFNPLTDLANMKARKQAEQDAATQATQVAATQVGATQAMAPTETAATQAFNPVTGQFESVPSAIAPNTTDAAVKTRAEQRAAAAKAKRKKQIIIGSIVGALALIAIIICAVLFMNGGDDQAETVTVPTFNSTTTKTRAQSELEALGLKAEIKDVESTEPEGTFVDQTPAGGEQVEVGSTVTVEFSAGPSSVPVPDVTDYSQDDARAALEEAGFTVNSSVRQEDSDTIEQGNVTRTDPVAGTTQSQGTSITLYVSTGMTTVPDVTGQTQEQALQLLQSERHFSVVVQNETSDTVAAGSVTRMEPGAGSAIEQRGNITIWVSTGKEQVSVPSVVGQTLASARSTLEAQGFTVAVATGSSTNDTAVVTAQDITGTTDSGATITLTTRATETDPDDTSGNNTMNR